MLKYNGGDRVGKGTYWNLNTMARIDVTDEGTLPEGKTAYYRMPAAALMLLAPVLGLMYAAFLPFIGIAMAVKLVGQKLGGGLKEAVQGSASFGFRPSESYLAGRKQKDKKDEASKEEDEKKED